MSNETIFTLMGIVIAIFAVVVFAYMFLRKKMQSSDVARIEKLRKGTQEKSFSSEVMYQKLYIRYLKLPFLIVKSLILLNEFWSIKGDWL